MKIGLSNVAAVIAVTRYGLLKTLELNLLRAFAVALITGLLMTPSFLLSVSGAASSAIVMGVLRRIWPRLLSTVGLSIAGAVLSLWTQLLAASVILGGLPLQNVVLLLTLWGIVSGSLIGVLAQKALEKAPESRVLRKAEG